MHNIGDKIVYGANGVMTIADIREESIGDVSRKYYVLSPALVRSNSLTFVPTDNEKLVAAMRPLLTREEIIALISESKNAPALDWVKENRARQERFKKILDSGDRGMLIAMIRAIEECAIRREAEGKKNFLADEGVKVRAEKLLISEFSIVLGIPEDEVKDFVASKLAE